MYTTTGVYTVLYAQNVERLSPYQRNSIYYIVTYMYMLYCSKITVIQCTYIHVPENCIITCTHNHNIPAISNKAGFELPILLLAVTIIVTLVTLVV